MPSRRIEDLRPVMQPRARALLAACATDGIDILVTCTLRTLGEQADLYAQGRTKPGRIVTNAPPGRSAHNYGLAMDVVPLRYGKLVWGTRGNGLDADPTDDDTDDLELWQRVGAIAEHAGLEWAGRWPRFQEFPHVQMPGWRDYISAPEQVT